MELERVFERVCACVERSCGIASENIMLGDTLIEGLGMDSLDLIDLLYELEKAFSIRLPVGDLETRVRREMGEEPFEIDRMITPVGLSQLKDHMPEVAPDRFHDGLMVEDIPYLFTVHSICNLVLRESQKQHPSVVQT